ncbi:flagellar hook-length control protein FliK [Sulfuricystis multivorans]|uniref:flagellar hook-length control protein FliK n=1 Tax=Sulfuricystis multivorans TaxID=2211108 RepID=UPI000F81A808|nr:flagellar hook-length control protein FliK [Sulfuricystis multivorans]
MSTTPALPTAAQAAPTTKLSSGEGALDAKTNGAASFAALIQRLAGKQVASALAKIDIPLPEDGPQDPTDAGNIAANALAQILDPLGLMKASANIPASEEPPGSDEPMPAATAVALAAPLTTVQVTANSAGLAAEPAALPAPSQGAEPSSQPSIGFDPHLSGKSEPGSAPAGREFAANLTSAITTAHEETHAPGNTAAAVQQVIANFSPAQSPHGHESLTISHPVGVPGWNEEIGNRITWIAAQGKSQAELVLNPPQLGRIEVSLTVNGDQAAASFASSNPVVRELLEAALPRLRELLADAGIQLGQAQVGAEHSRQQAQQEKHGDNPASDSARTFGTNQALSWVSLEGPRINGLKSGRGLVDVFA